jgi:hypothetical protein
LVVEGYLQEQAVSHGFGTTVSLGSKGRGWLASSRQSAAPSLVLMPSEPLSRSRERQDEASKYLFCYAKVSVVTTITDSEGVTELSEAM